MVLSRTVVAALLVLAALGASACSKLSGLAGGKCGSGETASEDPAFCYKVPKGFVAQGEPVKRGGWFNTAYGDGKAKINFIAREAGDFDALWRSLQGNAKNAKSTDAKEEDIAGGKGKLLTFSTPEKDPKHVVSMMVRGEKYILECEAEYRASAPKPELVEACKTMHEP